MFCQNCKSDVAGRPKFCRKVRHQTRDFDSAADPGSANSGEGRTHHRDCAPRQCYLPEVRHAKSADSAILQERWHTVVGRDFIAEARGSLGRTSAEITAERATYTNSVPAKSSIRHVSYGEQL